jgi:hypothetical protein
VFLGTEYPNNIYTDVRAYKDLAVCHGELEQLGSAARLGTCVAARLLPLRLLPYLQPMFSDLFPTVYVMDLVREFFALAYLQKSMYRPKVSSPVLGFSSHL